MKNFTLIIGVVMILMVQVSTAQTQLWGTCQNGGSRDSGTIFYCDINGNNFQTAYSFIDSIGANPLGELTLANNGKLYGITKNGGCQDSCVLYVYDPISGVYIDLHDFICDITHGWNALSGMLKASDGYLYGLCGDGGANGWGVIYKVDPNLGTDTDIFDFYWLRFCGGAPLFFFFFLTCEN